MDYYLPEGCVSLAEESGIIAQLFNDMLTDLIEEIFPEVVVNV